MTRPSPALFEPQAASAGIEQLRQLLAEDGWIDPAQARLTALSGGVSSDVVRVDCDDSTIVVKRALEKLKVSDDWFADVGRTRYEHLYMECVSGFLPHAVPRVLHVNDRKGYFCMEWLGEGWSNWKQCLLEGSWSCEHAREAGRILGIIHRNTHGDPALEKTFDSTSNFHQLRLNPYLLTTGRRHPSLQSLFTVEAERIASTRQCLIHGDYSPKNMLVRDGRLVVLDCEVAWYGDPSFDLAFLLSHLHLKALLHAPNSAAAMDLITAARGAYLAERRLDASNAEEFRGHVARLLLMLMLARVDGKSPVEYLAGDSLRQDFIRRFATDHLSCSRPPELETLTFLWFEGLQGYFSSPGPELEPIPIH